MENRLFRKKSMERISSPEELHDYMRVTSPRLWMILGAVLALLAGFIVYASTATMENTMDIKLDIYADQDYEEIDGKWQATGEMISICSSQLPASCKDIVKVGMVVRLGEEQGRITLIGEDETENITLFIRMDKNYIPLPDGIYDAQLVLESTTPISFLWN